MSEKETKPVLNPTLKPGEAKLADDKIKPPIEVSSLNDLIRVVIEGNECTIDIDNLIAQDIGCYRRVKGVKVSFTHGKPPEVVAVAID